MVTDGAKAGGELDEKFDASYEAFQLKMDELIAHVNKNVQGRFFLSQYPVMGVDRITRARILHCCASSCTAYKPAATR